MTTPQDPRTRTSRPRRLTVLGIVGSLRRESWNRKLYEAAKKCAPAGIDWVDADIADVPLYNKDVETEFGIPEAVLRLKRQAIAADAILLVTPEYNNSVPGVLKNATDWMSRKDDLEGHVFRDKPLGIMGATPGVGGTRHAQVAWLPVLRHLGVLPYFGAGMWVARAEDVFGEEGAMVDETANGFLARYMAGFGDFIRLHAQ